MANINSSVVIQLADAGVYDIITEFDVEHEHWSSGCPTCGSMDFDAAIATARVISTAGETEVRFLNETYFSDSDLMQKFMPTQADLMHLLLNKDTLEMLKTMPLQEFAEWLETSLYAVYDRNEDAYWDSIAEEEG